MRGSLCAVLVWIAVPMAMAQQPAAAPAQPAWPEPCVAAARPSFDVVSVKAIDAKSHSSSVHTTPDGITLTGALHGMILFSYNLHDFQLTGGPDWIATSTWEVHGKNDTPDPDYSKLGQAERKALGQKRMQQVQSILMERFRLKCHMTTKDLPIYELVVAKGGSKLKQASAEESKGSSTSTNGHGLQMNATATGITSGEIRQRGPRQID